jgi:hypothetical protein
MRGNAQKKVKPMGEVLLGTPEVGWKQRPPEFGMGLVGLLLHDHCMHSSQLVFPVPQTQTLLCQMMDLPDVGKQFQLSGTVGWKASLLQVH